MYEDILCVTFLSVLCGKARMWCLTQLTFPDCSSHDDSAKNSHRFETPEETNAASYSMPLCILVNHFLFFFLLFLFFKHRACFLMLRSLNVSETWGQKNEIVSINIMQANGSPRVWLTKCQLPFTAEEKLFAYNVFVPAILLYHFLPRRVFSFVHLFMFTAFV